MKLVTPSLLLFQQVLSDGHGDHSTGPHSHQAGPHFNLVKCEANDQADCHNKGCNFDEKENFCHFPVNLGRYWNSDIAENEFVALQKQNEWVEYKGEEKLTFKLMSQSKEMFGNSITTYDMYIEEISNGRIRIKMVDPNNDRFEVPIPIFAPDEDKYSYKSSNKKNAKKDYKIEYDHYGNIKITRKSSGKVLFDTSVGPIIYEDQFLQLSTRIYEEDTMYGLGEKFNDEHMALNRNKDMGFFSRGQGMGHDRNQYGTHPFYEIIEPDGKSHGVLLFNVNALEVSMRLQEGESEGSLTYKSVGGIFDLQFFIADNPERMLEEYTEAIGRPVLQPYWSLGFQICRWGYLSTEDVTNVFQENVDAHVPFDVQYVDIDYMNRKTMWTIAPEFEGIGEFIRDTVQGKYNKRNIIIFDPAIPANETAEYTQYTTGVDVGAYLSGYGKVWPVLPNWKELHGENWEDCDWRCQKAYAQWVQFPNFFKKATEQWWIDWSVKFHDTIPFDGLWIDMNEPDNFADGDVRDGCTDQGEKGKLNYPPFVPHNTYQGSDRPMLFEESICMDVEADVLDVDEIPSHITRRTNELRYNLHGLYGYSQIRPTMKACLASTNERCTVVGRSTFAGAGSAGAGHWLGDNESKWNHLRQAAIGPQEFSLFGMSYIGTDICGFFYEPSEELCIRWHQLGVMHTFARNHNIRDTERQDPAFWSNDATNMMIEAIMFRYTWLPEMYTLMYQAHVRGASVIRPVSHVFPADLEARDLPFQFFWGSSVMFSPAVYEGQTNVKAYLPEGARWYDMHSLYEVESGWNDIYTPIDHFNAHQKGGSILIGHDIDREYARSNSISTSDLVDRSYIMQIALDNHSEAFGMFYTDEWTSIDPLGNHAYNVLKFRLKDGKLTTSNKGGLSTYIPLNSIQILGAKECHLIDSITNNGEEVEFSCDNDAGVVNILMGQEINMMELNMERHMKEM